MKRLVLLGGGHAHLAVLDDLARRPLAGWDVQLITPFRRQIYSGMLPGWVASHYDIDACAIALDALAARAGVGMHLTAAHGLDLAAHMVLCADGSRIGFDRLSIDTGPVPALGALPGAAEHALAIRPIEHFVARWPGLIDRILSRCSRRFDLAILGAGAAGVELAFAIHRRATVDGWSHLRITLVGSGARPLEGVAERARARIAALMKQRGVHWLGHRQATRVDAGHLHFAEGESLAFDACLMVTGAAAPEWPRRSGLATDAQGFIRVDRRLQSVSHPQVMAAGDIAAYADARPKSGVFAVRAGPVLADHLRALCDGRAPGEWTPQARALYLISTGDRRALAAWGRWAWAGALEGWVWRWKDRIDRRFVARYGADDRNRHAP